MKKSLVALAALTVVGAASAQVTITGTTSFSYQKDLQSKSGLNLSDNSVFFTVTEDLGGGTSLVAKTGFDAGGRNVNGVTAAAQEDASVTLSGGFGAVKLSSYESDGPFANVMSLSGASLAQSVYDTNAVGLGKRFRNGISYTSPSFGGGFTVALAYVTLASQYASSTADSSNTKIVPSVTYANGPLKVYFEDAFFNADYPGTTNGSSNASASQPTLYATYDFGVAKVGAAATKLSVGDSQYAIGVNVPFGAVTFGLSSAVWKNSSTTGTTGDANWTEASIAYNLSKRTSIKASFAQVNDAGIGYANSKDLTAYGLLGGTANTLLTSNSQSRIGIFHTF